MPIPPHIARLRELVGTELLLVPAVAVLARDDAARVLLVRNAEAGLWTLPGGLLEPDERPDEAAAREAGEEAGIEVRIGGVLGVFGGPKFRTTYANGDEIAVMTAVYAGEAVGGEPQPDGVETDGARWFAVDEVAALELSARARAVLEALL